MDSINKSIPCADKAAPFWPLIDKLIAAHAGFCCYGRERLCPYHEGMVAGLAIALKASEAALDRLQWFDGEGDG